MRHLLVWLVRAYQLAISPLLHAIVGPRCRFHPNCSAYCIEALERHGAARGVYLTARRLVRCHPFNEGGLDPVPEKL